MYCHTISVSQLSYINIFQILCFEMDVTGNYRTLLQHFPLEVSKTQVLVARGLKIGVV